MITYDRITSYLHSLEPSNGELLDAIEQEALQHDVPIIRKETQSFLKTMVTLVKPKRILEIGTAVGFSALLMCEAAADTCEIHTIENYAPRIPIARENIRTLGRDQQITLIEGDATEVLQEMVNRGSKAYDLVFMDAAKAQYPTYLPYVLDLLTRGGVLLTDNVLQDGDLIESKYIIERRQRTIHKRMREYLYDLKHHTQLETSILPLGDGIAFSVKK